MIKSFYLGLMIVLLVSGCSNAEPADNSPVDYAINEMSQITSEMQKYKVDYIGDVSGVSQLITLLPTFDAHYVQNLFALQTQEAPYGLTLFYEPSSGVSTDVDMVESEEMIDFALCLIESIDNLGYVQYAYRRTPSNNQLEDWEYEYFIRINLE